jgi:hypothetical protein
MAMSAVSLILCHAVYEDPVSHNVTLLGIFTAMHATAFPTPYRDMSIYAILKGPPGETGEVTLSCTSAAKGTECARERQRVQIGERGKRQIHIRLGELRFPEPGEYLFSLAVDGTVVADLEFFVMERE